MVRGEKIIDSMYTTLYIGGRYLNRPRRITRVRALRLMAKFMLLDRKKFHLRGWCTHGRCEAIVTNRKDRQRLLVANARTWERSLRQCRSGYGVML